MFNKLIYDREYYQLHKVHCNTRNKRYYNDHKDKTLKWQKQYHKDHHKERLVFLKQWNAEYHKKHPSFVNWQAMMQRVRNPNNIRYVDYGGRGITVYESWKSFKIYEQEFGYSKPGPGYTVDRIDNNGNYEPGNVQWLTKAEHRKKQLLKD